MTVSENIVLTWNTAFLKFETNEFAFSTFSALTDIEFAIDKVFAFSRFSNPTKTSFDRRSSIVDFVAIEAEAHFETESVASTKTDRFDTIFSTCSEESIPNLLAILWVEIQFETTSTSVTSVRDDYVVNACEFTFSEVVVFDFAKVNVSKFLKHFSSFRTLNCKLSDAVRRVFEFYAFFVVSIYPFPVFVDICSVYNEHIFFVRVVVNDKVVNDTAFAVREAVVLSLTIDERRDVV